MNTHQAICENAQFAIRELQRGDCVAVLWSVEDVKSVRPDLSSSQCLAVLEHCARKELSWESIWLYADEMFPRS